MEVGNRVICIDASGKSSSLTKGREYIIHDLSRCSCGELMIDIGLSSPRGVKCYCGCIVSVKGDIDWCRVKRFRKVEEKVNYVKVSIEIEEPILN